MLLLKKPFKNRNYIRTLDPAVAGTWKAVPLGRQAHAQAVAVVAAVAQGCLFANHKGSGRRGNHEAAMIVIQDFASRSAKLGWVT